MLSFALYVHGFAFRDADPAGALDALRRGLVIARDSGNRYAETLLAAFCPALRPNTVTRWPRSITSRWRSATSTTRATPPGSAAALATLAVFFDRLGRHEPAATIAGFAVSPIDRGVVPEFNTAIAHLRDVLGEPTYESLARKGETMTTAAMVTYAYDQIDQARAELEHPS